MIGKHHNKHYYLSQQSVTKGARHKIIISIQKLKERQNMLRSLEKVRLFLFSLSHSLIRLVLLCKKGADVCQLLYNYVIY